MPLVQVVDQKAIEAVSERLRDTKRSVRRDAAVHLMAVFRLTACIACGFALSFWHTIMLCSSQTKACHEIFLFVVEAGFYQYWLLWLCSSCELMQSRQPSKASTMQGVLYKDARRRSGEL